jgi:hypothetical protein
MQKPGDRRLSDRDLFLPESIFEYGQRDIRPLSYQLTHKILVACQREILPPNLAASTLPVSR